MATINWGRLILGSLIAAIIMFITDGLIHGTLAQPDWKAIYTGLGASESAEHGMSMVYFAIFELGRGFTAIMFYVLMRAYFGAGPKTAVLAGIVGWIAFSLTGPVQFIPLGFYSRRLWVFVAAAQLATSIGTNMVAAWIYRDPATSATPVE